MSTNSLIGKERDNGNVEYIYCHFDGYLEGVGSVLQDYTSEDFDYLLSCGDASSIDYIVGSSEFYRDRGETDIDSRLVTKDTFIDGTGCDYNVYYRYLYTKDNELLCYKGDEGKKPKVIKL